MGTVTALQSVLALEFRGVGDTADFSFLTREYTPALVTRVDPISQHIGKPLTLAGQARQLVAQQPRPPDIVLAYCGTAALGLHLADLTGADTLLVDPYPITEADLFRDFTNLCTGMGFDPKALAAVTREANLADWEAFLLTRRDSMAAEHGGDDEAYELVDDLFDRYRSWLRFLFANVASAPAEPRGEILAITARQAVALEAMLTDPSRAQVHRVNYDEGGLLESRVIQDLVSIALGWHNSWQASQKDSRQKSPHEMSGV
jgi:hypothetical protein